MVDLKNWGVPEDDPVRHYLENVGKQYRTCLKVTSYLYEQHEGADKTKWDRVIDTSQTAAEVGAIWFPPLEVGLATYSLAQREFKDVQAQRALKDLGGALASNWKAEVHLRTKIEDLHTFAEEDRRTIRSWRGLDPAHRGGQEIR